MCDEEGGRERKQRQKLSALAKRGMRCRDMGEERGKK